MEIIKATADVTAGGGLFALTHGLYRGLSEVSSARRKVRLWLMAVLLLGGLQHVTAALSHLGIGTFALGAIFSAAYAGVIIVSTYLIYKHAHP